VQVKARFPSTQRNTQRHSVLLSRKQRKKAYKYARPFFNVERLKNNMFYRGYAFIDLFYSFA